MFVAFTDKKNNEKQHKITYTRNTFNNIRCRQNVEEKNVRKKERIEKESIHFVEIEIEEATNIIPLVKCVGV